MSDDRVATETCKWTEDSEGGLWESTCGRMFQFNDGGVKENEFRFCYYCGKAIEAFPCTEKDL